MATTQVGTITPWKQNSGGDMYQVYKHRASPKPRSTTSPRYVRTWSQEEESYLLEARKSRVPYKDIAARLNKTDLACRLHYHQMVVARKNSAQEESSIVSSPPQFNAFQYHARSESLPPISTTLSQSSMLLPAPIIRQPYRSGSGAATLSPNHRRSFSQPQNSGRKGSQSPPVGGVQKSSPIMSNKTTMVDLDRIQELYRDFAPTFWSNIAAAYSHGRPISPSEIETAFWQGQNTSRSISPSSETRSTSPASWPSAISTASTATSQASLEEQSCTSNEPHSAATNKTRCSVNALLND